MLSVRGIYEGGQVKLLEEIPSKKKAKVIVTVLEEEKNVQEEVDPTLFDDLIGVISVREDGSINHDQYLTSKGHS